MSREGGIGAFGMRILKFSSIKHFIIVEGRLQCSPLISSIKLVGGSVTWAKGRWVLLR